MGRQGRVDEALLLLGVELRDSGGRRRRRTAPAVHEFLPAERLFERLAKFAGYGFNKSHSAGYAIIAYQTAYLKAHYPEAFMAALISSGLYHCVLGSRILGGYALRGGMPAWKYVANRGLTLFTNVVLPAKLSEYHTGFRAFSRELLERVPWNENDDDFVFDGQMLAQVLWMGYVVAEITCPTRYGPASSSIGFARSVRYGLGCVATALRYRIAAWGWGADRRFPAALRGVARPAG